MEKELHEVDPQKEIERLIKIVGYITLFPPPITTYEFVPLTTWLNLKHQVHPVVLFSSKGYFGAVIHADTSKVDIMRSFSEKSKDAMWHALTRALQIVEGKAKREPQKPPNG